MYSIVVNRAAALIEVELGGLMTTEEVASYIAELRRAFITHRLRRYSILIDITACPIQTQDMLRAMGEHIATMPKADAVAIVTGSSLARMQVRRVFKQPYARIAATVAEGRDWVLHRVEPRAA